MKRARRYRGRKILDDPGQTFLFDAERYCGRCGRRLRGDQAIKRGFGRTCWRKKTSDATAAEVTNLAATGQTR